MSNRIVGFVPAESLSDIWSDSKPIRRADLHCHSDASNEADEAALNAIQCPESFSAPSDVLAQACRNGMDFVTITDHDSIDGVTRLLDHPNVLVGEEVTCFFPEDRCKIHLLVWGINAEDHSALQAAASDIYEVARVVAERRLAHAVAHPLYRQNDRLEKWHLERLILLFKGFETLNGAHSVLHRQGIEPMLDELSAEKICELAETHGMSPRWPMPHLKSRTGGSDDHGLFNIGRTWTEFPGWVTTTEQVLECLRLGHCRPGGEAGSSLKLAHNFYGVGIRYYDRKIKGEHRPLSMGGIILRSLIGERRQIRRRDVVKLALKKKVSGLGKRLVKPFRKPAEPSGAALLLDLFFKSCSKRIGDHDAIQSALRNGRAALGEHAAMFDLVSDMNRDIAEGIANSVSKSMGRGELSGIFDSLAAISAHQFMLLPYYFAMFHQNRERHLMPRMTGCVPALNSKTMKLGVFTDTFDEINGVARFIQDMSREARKNDRTLVVHTSAAEPRVQSPCRKNFLPLLSCPLPGYAAQPLTIPPLAEILEWADRQQFDAIHVHTPGPMGMCGWLVGKMLRVPVLGTYHTDFPQYVQDIIGDHRLSVATMAFMKWFYGQTETIFSRSKEYRVKLRKMGFAEEKLAMMLPGVDTQKFRPTKRDDGVWKRLGVTQPRKLLYAGRVSVEKNLPFLAETFRQLCTSRRDTALIIAGDGPYQEQFKRAVSGLPVFFLGYQNDEQLAALYSSSDLFVFPSKTDTLGQVVIEAQAAGLPVLVSDQGGPKEVMDDQITGLVLAAENPKLWTRAIDSLLDDTTRRQRMSRTAAQRMARFSLGNVFESFWEEHLKLARRTAGCVEEQLQVAGY